MKTLRPVCAFVVLGSTAVYGDTLEVTASPATASIRPTNSEQLRLPDLSVKLLIQAGCRTGGDPVSLTIAGADTVREFGPDTLADATEHELVFQLPARQVPPVPARGFCSAGGQTGSPAHEDTLWKPAFVSLHVALRCAYEKEETMTSENAVVDLRLKCEREAPAGQESSE